MMAHKLLFISHVLPEKPVVPDGENIKRLRHKTKVSRIIERGELP